MVRRTREVWQILKLNIGNILLFSLIYRLITLPFYVRMVNRGIRFALDMAGYSYLTVENIGRFLLRPWTLALFLALGMLGALLLSVEVAGIITALEEAACHRRVFVAGIFAGGVKRIRREICRYNAGLFLLVLVEYLMMCLFCLYRILTHIKPFNFILMEIWRGRMARWVLLLFIAVCVLVVVTTAFVIPVCLVERASFAEAFRKNLCLLRGHILRMSGFVLLINVLPVLWMIVCYGAAVLMAAVFTLLFVRPDMMLAVLLEVSERVELILLFFGSLLSVVANLAAVMVMYYQYGQALRREPGWDFATPGLEGPDRKRVVSVMLLIGAVSAFCLFDMVRNGERMSADMFTEIQITAHRGSVKTAPENTMAAVEAAIEEMADMAEIDVQLTRDGEVVVCHDINLKRLTGVDRTVASMDWEELSALDVGSRFSAQYAGEGIPLLKDIMEQSKGRILLNIELKNVGKNSELPQKVADLISEYEMEEQCVVTSTSLCYLETVKEIQPKLRTGYIIAAVYGDYYSEEALDFISIRSGFVNKDMVERAHEHGKAVHAWTVNSKSELERMKLLQVDNVITDYPVLAREILYREEATESLMEYLRLALRI